MMPQCYWKRCHRVGLNKIGIDVEFQHPYICDKHMIKLLKKLNISTEGYQPKDTH